MALIQVGGLGLVTFHLLFQPCYRQKLGLRGMKLPSESVNPTRSLSEVPDLALRMMRALTIWDSWASTPR